MKNIRYIGELLIQRKEELSVKVTEKLEGSTLFERGEGGNAEGEAIKRRETIFVLIGQALVLNSKEKVWKEVEEWSIENGENAVEEGLPLDESLLAITKYRDIIWEAVEEALEKEPFDCQSIIAMSRIVDSILDYTGCIFSSAYVKHYQRTVRLARQAISDISVPVVAISDKTAILPLVGELDTYRARILMESSLKKCMDLRISELIIDLSGVPVVDTMVAHELFQVAKALKLLGVRPTFTGMRPDIAQAVVGLGIDFKEVTVKGTLKQALKEIEI